MGEVSTRTRVRHGHGYGIRVRSGWENPDTSLCAGLVQTISAGDGRRWLSAAASRAREEEADSCAAAAS